MGSAVASRWKPYPEYKSIQHAGIEKIPNHWDSNRMRYVFRERGEVSEDGTEELLSVSKYTGVKVRSTTTDREARAASLVGYKKCEPNDIVSNIMLAWDSALGVAFDSGIVSSAYEVYVPQQEIDPHFLDLLLRTPEYRVAFTIVSKGIVPSRWRMYTESFNDIQMILPSLSEQKQIGNFVHMINQNISGNIKNLETQISLLDEKRSAIITQAVTKGLNPDVPMKDTGLDWYPEVPAHWELRRVKHIATIRPSNVDKKKYDGQEEVRLANYVDVYKNDQITNDLELMVATAAEHEIAKFSLLAGDFIITKDSETWDDIAVPAFVPKTMEGVVCGYHLTLIRPNRKYVLGEFLFRTYQAIGVQDQYHYNANGVTRYGLGSYWVDNGIVPVPPLNEQHEIAEYIDNQLGIMEMVREKTESEIERFKEYRTALISAAVTGKIDVRGLA